MSELVQRFRERYGTALLVDAAFRVDARIEVPSSGIYPLDLTSGPVGPVVTVEAEHDLVSIIAAVHSAQEGDVVVIANRGQDAGLIGDLIGAEAVRKGLGGFVVDGSVRDVAALIDLGIPVSCRGQYPVGPLKLPGDGRRVGRVGGSLSIGGALVDPGMWVFGDADGVIFLRRQAITSVFAEAERILHKEDALAAEIAAGTSLGDAFQIEEFLAARDADPGASFNQHLKEIGRAI